MFAPISVQAFESSHEDSFPTDSKQEAVFFAESQSSHNRTELYAVVTDMPLESIFSSDCDPPLNRPSVKRKVRVGCASKNFPVHKLKYIDHSWHTGGRIHSGNQPQIVFVSCVANRIRPSFTPSSMGDQAGPKRHRLHRRVASQAILSSPEHE